MSKSKIEIVATDAAGRVFMAYGDVTWNATRVEDSETPFRPHEIRAWRILEDDGSTIGWLPLPLKQEDDDDEAEAEG